MIATRSADFQLPRFFIIIAGVIVIGGTSTFGGVGGYTSTILGALILSVLNSMLTFLNVDSRVIILSSIILESIITRETKVKRYECKICGA